jgi:APA family basic amino acid/polyamine antiporter
MARDGVWFPSLGRVDPRYATPAVALLIQGGWSILLASTGTYKQLYTYVIFTGWLFYAAATFAVVVLRRKRPTMERPYRVWGYPVVPIAFSAAALTIVANALFRSPTESGIGLMLVLAGAPIYFFWRRKAAANQKAETRI